MVKLPLTLMASMCVFVLAPISMLVNSGPGLDKVGQKATASAPARDSSRPEGTVDTGDHQGKEPAGVHVVRVLDAASKAPVRNAKITVELQSSGKTKWAGLTNANGVFTFDCAVKNGSVKTQITVQAAGFWTLTDDGFPLVDERILLLSKAD